MNWIPICIGSRAIFVAVAGVSWLVGIGLYTQPAHLIGFWDNGAWAHFFGWFGFVVCSQSILVGRSNKALSAVGLITTGILIFIIVITFRFYQWWYVENHLWALPACVGLMACILVLGLVHRAIPNFEFLEQRPWLILFIPAGYSLSWELVIQPYFYVYDGPARGYVQWDQVSADWMAIMFAGLCAYYLTTGRFPWSRRCHLWRRC